MESNTLTDPHYTSVKQKDKKPNNCSVFSNCEQSEQFAKYSLKIQQLKL